MQSTLGKFFKPANKESRLEMHDFLFEKERADEKKRLRAEEQAELDGIKELVERDEERTSRREQEKRQASDREREGRLKRHASLAEGREIVPNLYLGGRLAAQNWEWLQQCGIRTVVNVTGDVTNYYENEEGFRYHRCEIEDTHGSQISLHFDTTAELIRKELEEGRAVLCHCREGLSRSPTIVIAFLMQEMNMTVEDALKMVEEKNGMIRINKGFLAELNGLHKQLFNQDSSLFDPRERVDKVSYDDMTTAEKKAYEAQMARKNRVKKKPLTLAQFIELKSMQIREKAAAAAAAAASTAAGTTTTTTTTSTTTTTTTAAEGSDQPAPQSSVVPSADMIQF